MFHVKTTDRIQIDHKPDATLFQFIILTFVYSLTCFGRFPAHHQELNDCSGSLWFYLRIVVTVMLSSWSDRPARPRTQPCVACPVIQYFSTLSYINGKGFERKGFIDLKKCISIFSTTFVWNIFHSKQNWARYDQICVLVFM